MRYIKLIWHTADVEDPKYMYVEVDDNRWEVRRIEYYKYNVTKLAGFDPARDDSFLSPESWPPLEEINSNPEFTATYTDKLDFDERWRDAVEKRI